MAKKKNKKEQDARRAVRVGDRVRFRVGTREIIADVVEDRGNIGVDGRHAVAVSFAREDGEVERFDWPADELTVIPRNRATA